MVAFGRVGGLRVIIRVAGGGRRYELVTRVDVVGDGW